MKTQALVDVFPLSPSLHCGSSLRSNHDGVLSFKDPKLTSPFTPPLCTCDQSSMADWMTCGIKNPFVLRTILAKSNPGINHVSCFPFHKICSCSLRSLHQLTAARVTGYPRRQCSHCLRGITHNICPRRAEVEAITSPRLQIPLPKQGFHSVLGKPALKESGSNCFPFPVGGRRGWSKLPVFKRDIWKGRSVKKTRLYLIVSCY